jgi:glutamate synthase (NADPH/NADH) small chain
VGKPDGFLEFTREGAPCREIEQRVKDYDEVELAMPGPLLKAQSARCMDCGIPFCHGSGCPIANRIPEMNDRIYRGRWREASEILHTTDNFPEITGRVCPALCESACTLGIHGEAVTIRNLERMVADRAWAEGWVKPIPPAFRTGRKVAVIGSGPAGLTVAQQLARKGHEVVVFEKELRVGGLLRYGIPDFKLPKPLIDRRVAQMEAEGVSFVKRVKIGDEISLQYLLKRFDAIVVAIGASVPRDLAVPGRELGGVHLALDYLGHQIRLNAGEAVTEPIDADGRRVLIVGGGDTGSDCVGTAVRQGAREIHQIELLAQPPDRRSLETPWPSWPRLLRTTTSHQEGCSRQWGVRTDFLEGVDGRVARWHGREAGTDEVSVRNVDLVILAMGFLHSDHAGVADQLGLEVNAAGNIRTDSEGRTGVPNVFVTGDAALGASLVVKAIQTGRQTALAVDRFLKG